MRNALWVFGFLLAVLIGVIGFTALTETTCGTVPNLSALTSAYDGGSKNFDGYPGRSIVNSFPFSGEIHWCRRQIRSQVHLSGHTDMKRLPMFISQTALSYGSLGEREAAFIAEEPGVFIMGKVDIATAKAEIDCLATKASRRH